MTINRTTTWTAIVGFVGFAVGVVVAPFVPGSGSEGFFTAMGFIFVGLGFLATAGATFAATAANKISQDALHAQMRPWISLSVEVASDLLWAKSGPVLSVSVTANNHGHSPALKVLPFAMILRAEHFSAADAAYAAAKEQLPNTRSSNPLEVLGRDIFPGESVDMRLPCIPVGSREKTKDKGFELHLAVGVTYDTVFSDQDECSTFVVARMFSETAGVLDISAGRWSFKEGVEVPRGKIRIVREWLDGGEAL